MHEKEAKIMNLDKKLSNDLTRLNITIDRCIFSNQRKNRYVFLINFRGKKAILKWNNPDNIQNCNSLKNEIEYYINNKSTFIPKLLYFEDYLFIIQYYENDTLRDWLIQYQIENEKQNPACTWDSFKQVIQNLMLFIDESYIETNTMVNKEPLIFMLRGYFNNLCYSTSSKYTALNRCYHFCLKLERVLFSKSINKAFHRLDQILVSESIKSYKIHADLHLNNILIEKDNYNIKIIDWENHTEGALYMDLNYLYAFIQSLLEGLPKHQHYVCTEFKSYLSKKDPSAIEPFFYIHKIYYAGVLLNKDFSYKKNLKSIIKSMLMFHRNINSVNKTNKENI